MAFAPNFNQALLGLVIDEAAHWAKRVRAPVSTAKVHLLCYVLHRLGMPFAYLFDLHYYGPHSVQLATDLKTLINRKLVATVPPGPGAFAELLVADEATLLHGSHGRALQKERPRLRQNMTGLAPLSVEELEVLATVDAVSRSLRRAIPESELEKAVVESIGTLKRGKFTAQQISDTYQSLLQSVLFKDAT